MKIWKLELAPTKCVVIRICNKNPFHSYFINDFELPIQTLFKDFGITFNDNMSFNTNINTICNKAHLIINRLFICVITNDYIYTSLKTIYHMITLLCNRIHLFGIQTISYVILTI